jgi:hypothetical protein
LYQNYVVKRLIIDIIKELRKGGENMKKILFALLAIAFASSLCFAQPAQAPVSKPTPSPVVTQTLTGKVDSVTIGDATKGMKSELIVVADNGQKLNFLVKSGTPITDKDGKAVTLSDIKKGSKVTVEYTTKASGTNKAQSIKLVE